jgi:multidrug resistance efflux pump
MNVASVVPAPASNTFVKVVQRIPVRVALDGAVPSLRPGMSAEVSVER